MEEYKLFILSIIFITGLLSGMINTIAGGGSSLTIPVLILAGLPGNYANATNRVSVFFQSISGLHAFNSQKNLPVTEIKKSLIPTSMGGALGAWGASIIPNKIFEPLIFVVMIGFSFYLIFSQRRKASQIKKETLGQFGAFWIFFGTGFYGGFLQTGVGILLLLSSQYSYSITLKESNALKLSLVLPFTAIALIIFIYHDLIIWQEGLTLALGSILGAQISARFANRISEKTLKWITLFLVTGMTFVYAVRKYGL